MKNLILFILLITLLTSCSTLTNFIYKINGNTYYETYNNKDIVKFDNLLRTLYNNYYDYNDSLIKYSFIKSENIYFSNEIDSINLGRSLKLCFNDLIKVRDNKRIIKNIVGHLIYKIKESDMKFSAYISQNSPDDPILVSVSFSNEKTCNYNKWERWGPH